MINTLAFGTITVELSEIFQLEIETVLEIPLELLDTKVKSKNTGIEIPDSKSIEISTFAKSNPSISSGRAEISFLTVSIETSTVSTIPVMEPNHKVSINTSMAIESLRVNDNN